MSTAILIPARNEAPRLGAVLRDAKRAVGDATLFVVDGHSEDDTADVARDAGARVILQQGAGYGAALRTGYLTLLDAGFTRVVQLDADGQHPARHAPALLTQLGDANLVIASRNGTRSPGGVGRRAGNALLALGVRHLTGLPLRDVTSGFWALDTRALHLLAHALTGPTADANVRVLAARGGLRIAEVPVHMPNRDHGASMHDGIHGVRNLWRSVRAAVQARHTIPSTPSR